MHALLFASQGMAFIRLFIILSLCCNTHSSICPLIYVHKLEYSGVVQDSV